MTASPPGPDTSGGAHQVEGGGPRTAVRWQTVNDGGLLALLADTIFAAVSSAYVNDRPTRSAARPAGGRHDEEQADP